MRKILLLLITLSIFSADYDVALIGTSPFSLFEALYQYHSGKTVLILEQSSACGGAWKTINICGIANVDLGCHQIGKDPMIKSFLEEYAGCRMVSHDNPLLPFDEATSANGYYFSKGCFELIDHLLKLIAATQIDLKIDHKVESISIDALQKMALIKTEGHTFSANKLIVTPMSCFALSNSDPILGKSKYYHIYLLIQDSSPPRFTYHGNLVPGISRVINLTHHLGLSDSGQHLIAIQTHSEQDLSDPNALLEGLKSNQLVDQSAYILRAETSVYESGYFHQHLISQTEAQGIIEVLQTGHFTNLAKYIPRWKQVLKPYHEVIPYGNSFH